MNEKEKKFNLKKIREAIDYTLLKPDTTRQMMDNFLSRARKYDFKRVFVSPDWVSYTRKEMEYITIGTTSGFPLGFSTVEAKCFEAEKALKDGANEIDFVVNIGKALDLNFDYIEHEMRTIAGVVDEFRSPDNPVNVKSIIEICYLNKKIMKELVEVAVSSGLDYVKTSTGFGPEGAKLEDVKFLVTAARERVNIKASGGIRNLEKTVELIEAGAARIGTSSGDKIIKQAVQKFSGG